MAESKKSEAVETPEKTVKVKFLQNVVVKGECDGRTSAVVVASYGVDKTYDLPEASATHFIRRQKARLVEGK